MKRSSKVSGFIAFMAITALAAVPLHAEVGGGMTTADLALQLARAAGISLPTGDSPQAALASLGKAGITPARQTLTRPLDPARNRLPDLRKELIT